MLNTVALNTTKANSTEFNENLKNMEELVNAIEDFLAVYIIPVTSAFGIVALITSTVIICLSKKIRIFQKYILYKNLIEFLLYRRENLVFEIFVMFVFDGKNIEKLI